MEILNKETKDRKAERELKRDAMALERERMAMEEKDRQHRYEIEKAERANLYELLKTAILAKRSD